MKPITRDVVADLWPLYESGEASADTKALIEEFLAADPAFAPTLRARPALEGPVMLNPDVETAALKRTRDLVRGNSWLRGLRLVAVALTAIAVTHVIRDTAWTIDSTRLFFADAGGAAVAWTLYAVLLRQYRRRALS